MYITWAHFLNGIRKMTRCSTVANLIILIVWGTLCKCLLLKRGSSKMLQATFPYGITKSNSSTLISGF